MDSAPKIKLELHHICSKTLQYECENSDGVEFTVKEEEAACDSCGTDGTESAPETQIELSCFKSNTEQTVQTKTVCGDTPHTEKVIELGVIISTNVQIENANSLTVKCEANLSWITSMMVKQTLREKCVMAMPQLFVMVKAVHLLK